MGTEDGAATGEDQAPHNSDQAGSDSGENPADFPPERYRGIQRQLSAAERRVQEAEARAKQLEDQLKDSTSTSMLEAVLTELQKADPDKAADVAGKLETQALRDRLNRIEQERETERQQVELNKMFQEAIARNMEELRETARAMGADPDSSRIDYGEDNEPIHARIRKVRESVLALRPRNPAKPQDESGNEVPRDGAGTHNTQTGTRTVADEGPRFYSDAEINAQRLAYGKSRSAADAAKLREMLASANI